MPHTHNIYNASWTEEKTSRGDTWKYLDLSGEHLGVRIEELKPGDSSSIHHFHTAEEEHILILEGSATLHLGFASGEETPHHIENTSEEPVRFLVFGERNPNDIVVYPEHQVMLTKGLHFRRFTYRDIETEENQ